RRIFISAISASGISGFAVQRALSEPVWRGRIFITPDVDPALVAGIFFSFIIDGQARYQTPLLHLIDGEVTTNASSAPRRYDGDTFIFGGGPRLAVATFTANSAF